MSTSCGPCGLTSHGLQASSSHGELEHPLRGRGNGGRRPQTVHEPWQCCKVEGKMIFKARIIGWHILDAAPWENSVTSLSLQLVIQKMKSTYTPFSVSRMIKVENGFEICIKVQRNRHMLVLSPLLFVHSGPGSESKESACSAGGPGSIPRLGRSPAEGSGNPLQYSCLENTMDRGAWWATVQGVAESDTTE